MNLCFNLIKYFLPGPSSHIALPQCCVLGIFLFLKKCQLAFATHSTVKVQQVNYSLAVSSSALEEMRVKPDVLFSPHIWSFPPRNAVNITAHLLDLCCSRSYYWTLPTCGPHGSAAVSDCGDCAGAESDWASKDGRCRWAIIACRRCRSLQSCKWRWRKEAEIVVDGVTL